MAQIAVDMGLFQKLEDRSPQTKDELVAATQADPTLLGKFLL